MILLPEMAPGRQAGRKVSGSWPHAAAMSGTLRIADDLTEELRRRKDAVGLSKLRSMN
jgi:hypothetical protein